MEFPLLETSANIVRFNEGKTCSYVGGRLSEPLVRYSSAILMIGKSLSEQSRPRFRTILRALGWFLLRAGALLTFAGPLIFCAQCLVGLKRGVWPSLDFQMLFGATAEPGTMAAILLGIPVWIAVLIIGCMLLYLGVRINRTLDSRMSI